MLLLLLLCVVTQQDMGLVVLPGGCRQVLMRPCAALCAAPAHLVFGDDMIAGAPCAAPLVLLCSGVGSKWRAITIHKS
jgi:hypothetical protein